MRLLCSPQSIYSFNVSFKIPLNCEPSVSYTAIRLNQSKVKNTLHRNVAAYKSNKILCLSTAVGVGLGQCGSPVRPSVRDSTSRRHSKPKKTYRPPLRPFWPHLWPSQDLRLLSILPNLFRGPLRLLECLQSPLIALPGPQTEGWTDGDTLLSSGQDMAPFGATAQ